MNAATQRLLPAILLTIVLHGALLSWQMQQPQAVRPKPLAQKITVSLTQLPPPAPPVQKIVQHVATLPQLAPAEHQPLKPVLARPKPLKKIVQNLPSLPKIVRVQQQPLRPLLLKPGQKISTTLPVLPKIPLITQQAIQPLKAQAIQPIPRPAPQDSPAQQRPSQPVRSQPLLSQQRPIVRSTTSSPTAYRQTARQPVRSRQVHTATANRTTPAIASRTAPASRTEVVREAAPLYQSNPAPEYPRMAKRRGLEGLVTIEVKVDPKGRVAELRLFASSGHSLLDKAALQSVQAWKFSPGTVGGRALAMWVKVPVRFELH